MDSALDSTNPQNPHKKHKMDGCVVWLIEVGKERGDSTFGKRFFRFCDFGLFFLRDSTQSAESRENKNKADL